MRKLLALFTCLGIVGYANFCFAAAPHQKIYLKSGEAIEGWVSDTTPDGLVKIQERRTRKISSYPKTDIVRIEDYNSQGKLFKEFNYEDGKKEGTYKIHHSDGTLYEEGFYENDQPEGIRRQYYENGRVRWEAAYLNGHLRYHKEYDETGSLISERKY